MCVTNLYPDRGRFATGPRYEERPENSGLTRSGSPSDTLLEPGSGSFHGQVVSF
jgi:hypothetical protein